MIQVDDRKRVIGNLTLHDVKVGDIIQPEGFSVNSVRYLVHEIINHTDDDYIVKAHLLHNKTNKPKNKIGYPAALNSRMMWAIEKSTGGFEIGI